MPIVATISTATGASLSLDKFLTPDGRVPDVAMVEEEELLANGADGRRYRTVSNRFRSFTVSTLETASTYAAAVTKCREYDKMKGTNVRLSVSIGGTSYSYSRVHVNECSAQASPGAVSGSATPSNAAHINANITFTLMEVTQGQNQ